MRIPRVEDNIKPSTNLLVDPKIIKLIENLANQPLLIEKLIIKDNQLLQIIINQNAELKQINIPASLSKELSILTSGSTTIKLNMTNNQIVVNLTPLNSVSPTLTSHKNDDLTLYFKQANLTAPDILQLTHNVMKSLPLINESKIAQNIPVKSNNNVFNSKLEFDEKNEISLKQAISYFLKSKPVDSPALANNINQLVQLQNKLVTSLIKPTKTLNEVQIAAQIKGDIILNKSEMVEMLQKITSLFPEEKLYSKFGSLNSKIDSLVNRLDFSPDNKQLKLEQRIQANGNFLESSLHKNDSEKQSSNRVNNTSVSNDVSKQLQPALPDLKLSALSIKQTLEALLKDLSFLTDKPLVYSKIFDLLRKHPAFIRLSSANNSSNTNFKQNNQTLDIPAKLMQSNLQQTLTNMGEKPLPNPFIFINQTPSIESGDALLKATQHFNSSQLKNIFSNESLLNSAIKINLNQKQLESLLLIQKQIIREMLVETSATINKIETNQLLSLRAETPLLQQFLLDLPIYHGEKFDSFEFLFESKNQNDDTPAKCWTVTIRFDLEPLGPMFAKVSLKNERISTHFFAKDPNTTRLLQENMQHLKDSLLFAGLDIDELTGQQGIVPNKLLINDELSVDVHV